MKLSKAMWIASLVLLSGAATIATIVMAAQINNTDQPTSGGANPVIKDYGRAWPMRNAEVQPQKGRTYKAIFSLSQAAPNPSEVVPGLADAARLMNVFASQGLRPKDLKVVAIFHDAAGYAAMSNDVYGGKFHVDNPNVKIIQELNAAGVELLLNGQAFSELNIDEKDLLPEIKLAASAAVALVTYQNDGYALIPF